MLLLFSLFTTRHVVMATLYSVEPARKRLPLLDVYSWDRIKYTALSDLSISNFIENTVVASLTRTQGHSKNSFQLRGQAMYFLLVREYCSLLLAQKYHIIYWSISTVSR
ncbi:hypothetical protein GGR57DRAFT_476711 [Xylariaceae sp. FL1272]|nr:hypothetical protein GGR57DRAFT_476711 [Xylariaceae sp. FL1272]